MRARLAPFLCAFCAFLGMFLGAPPSRAAVPTVVVVVDGPGADSLAAELTKEKLGGLAASSRKAKSVPCKLGAAKGPEGKAQVALDACVRKKVEADVVVLVVVTKGPKGRVADVRVIRRDGDVTSEHVKLDDKAGPSDASKVKGVVEPALAAMVPSGSSTTTVDVAVSAGSASGAGNAGSAEPPSDEAPDHAAEKETAKNATVAHPGSPRIVVTIGPGYGARSFSYSNGAGPTIRPYSLPAAFLLSVSAEAYPGDDGEGVRFRPGLAFGYVTSSGLTSQTDVGRSIGNTWTRFDLGLRGRLALGGERAPTFTLGFGYAREAFIFTEADPSLPGAVYLTLRASLDARVPLGPVALLAGFAALPAVRLSGFSDTYKHRSTLGLEGMLGLAVPFARTFEFRLLASHTRYSTQFEASPVTTSGATRAVDSTSRLQVILAFLY